MLGADGLLREKADPFAFAAECPPHTASKLSDIPVFRWTDDVWRMKRAEKGPFSLPLNIYELHAGSWRRHSDGQLYSYTELGAVLVPYLLEMGYTALELMPLTEHPYLGSWGYQTTGYFAATARYGPPEELMALVDACHAAGIAVLFDWVPGHFCADLHGLADFTGQPLYERGRHPQWGTCRFDYRRGEVRSFLIASALYWLKVFHGDGLRVDGVTSMLYLNFGIEREKEKIPGADTNGVDPDAVRFLQELNRTIAARCPGAVAIAEESTAWPLVTRPPEDGGLGFHYKWNMGWMNDTLDYFAAPFGERSRCHGKLTFSLVYAFSENFLLPLSHDEVVHGKRSLLGRMPGDYRQRFAGLRALMLWQMTHPGGKLTFMGSEMAPFIEWREEEELEWFLLDYPSHRAHRNYLCALNRLWRTTPALYAEDTCREGFCWLEPDDAEHNILAFERVGAGSRVTVALNLSPTAAVYFLGVEKEGLYRELFNSDDPRWGGSGCCNAGLIASEKIPWQGKPYRIRTVLPPLGGVLFTCAYSCPAQLKKERGNYACFIRRKPFAPATVSSLPSVPVSPSAREGRKNTTVSSRK